MFKPHIAVARPLPDLLMQALGQLGNVGVIGTDEDALNNANILVCTAMDPMGAELIEQLPENLGLIANIGVGIDNIDLSAATDRGIAVSNTPVVTEDTADLTMALLLATCRRLNRSEQLLRDGDWAAGTAQLGVRAHGKTLGIIGFGAIGQAVARRARGFGMNICYHGPNPKTEAAAELNAHYYSSLGALLSETDFISLNCPLTESTRHLLNEKTLALLKSGAIVINTGRGQLINEAALVKALDSGNLGGAGLDVFEFEPRVTPDLLRFHNVTLLPHIGSATGECRTDMAMRAIANIKHFLEHDAPLDTCQGVQNTHFTEL